MTAGATARLPALAVLLAAATGPALADRPGDFDFYVLSLSWSPSYCEAEGLDYGMQCDGRADHGFVVHGLWPQYERGWPEYCDVSDEPSRREVDGILDLMPSPGLVRHQWRRHGSCSGLDPADYFALMREARDAVTVPDDFATVDRRTTLSPDRVEQAFLAANPGMAETGIAVTCSGRLLEEVRVCLTPDLGFRSCPEVDRRDCRGGNVTLPAVR